MTTRSALRLWLGCIVIFVLSSTVSAVDDDDVMKTLIAEYKAYELPMPSDQAVLSVLKWSTGTINDVPQYRHVLAFVVRTDGEGKPDRFWSGCRLRSIGDQISVTPAKPTLANFAITQPLDTDFNGDGFQAYPDLALAVQCAARGWDELAAGVLARSRRGSQEPFSRRRARPADPGVALATLAWNYWCEEFSREKGDRAPIVERLLQLHRGPHGLNAQAHKNVVEDMRKTLAPTTSAAGSVESLIDSLIDLGIEDGGGWTPNGLANLGSARWHGSYRKLQEMGLVAVPDLLQHTHDFRMTRCVETDDRGTWQIRIADVVRQLLNGLVREEFAYDRLIREGRGNCVDRAHVVHWWAETQQVEAREYLLANAITEDTDGTRMAHEAILRALGHSYPEDLVKLIAENLDRVKFPDAMFEALGDSKASMANKAELFLRGAKSPNSWARDSALRGLRKMNHPQSVPLLINELDAIPKTPKEPYWQSTAGRFAQLVTYSDDPRVWAALVDNAKRVDMGQRLEMIQAIGARSGRKDDKAVDFLAAFLDDKEARVIHRTAIEPSSEDLFSGPSAGFIFERLSVRDFAALQLAPHLGVKATADSSWKDADWDALRVRVREALARRKP